MRLNEFILEIVKKIIKMKKKKISKIQYVIQKKKYNEECTRVSFLSKKKDEFPILYDIGKEAGAVDGHYFLQDIYVANVILNQLPTLHYDIGSRIDGFIAHLLAGGIKVSSIDIRPLPYAIDNLTFTKGDATKLSGIADKSIFSLSSLHAIEHFGLGRYGDHINPEACFEAMKSTQRVLAEGGYLYLSVPVGKQEKCCFNAHRIFLPSTIIANFSELNLLEFSYVHDMKLTTVRSDIKGEELDSLVGEYDCGIFVFKRIQN